MSLHRKWSSPLRISSVNVQTADLVTYTEEILNGKLLFLGSVFYKNVALTNLRQFPRTTFVAVYSFLFYYPKHSTADIFLGIFLNISEQYFKEHFWWMLLKLFKESSRGYFFFFFFCNKNFKKIRAGCLLDKIVCWSSKTWTGKNSTKRSSCEWHNIFFFGGEGT